MIIAVLRVNGSQNRTTHGAFPTFSVAHRGSVVDDVVAHALGISERFEILAAQVERMEQRELAPEEQIGFAERALALRYPEPAEAGMAASVLPWRPPKIPHLWPLENPPPLR